MFLITNNSLSYNDKYIKNKIILTDGEIYCLKRRQKNIFL